MLGLNLNHVNKSGHWWVCRQSIRSSDGQSSLTLQDRSTHIRLRKISRQYSDNTFVVPCLYSNWHWLTVKLTPRNKLRWNLNLNTKKNHIQENDVGNVVCKMAIILFRPQCVSLHGFCAVRQVCTVTLVSVCNSATIAPPRIDGTWVGRTCGGRGFCSNALYTSLHVITLSNAKSVKVRWYTTCGLNCSWRKMGRMIMLVADSCDLYRITLSFLPH